MIRKRYDNEKVNTVGSFFEELTQALLICERAPHDEGDFCIWNKNVGIETKASDANHEFRLPLHQIELYRRISQGFPFDSFFFLLFSYENPYIKNGDRGRITSLSLHDEKIAVRDFIARNLNKLFIIDLAVVDFLFSTCRVSDKSIPLHPGVKSLNIRPSYLDRLVNGGWQAITSKTQLQAKSLSCDFHFEPDLLESFDMKFNVAIISSEAKINQIISSFNPRVSLK